MILSRFIPMYAVRMALLCGVGLIVLILISGVYATTKKNHHNGNNHNGNNHNGNNHNGNKPESLLKIAEENLNNARTSPSPDDAVIFASYAIAYCNSVLILLPQGSEASIHASKLRKLAEEVVTGIWNSIQGPKQDQKQGPTQGPNQGPNQGPMQGPMQGPNQGQVQSQNLNRVSQIKLPPRPIVSGL